ncbi:hypothetical protein [Azonexus sp.]|uniref:hypothetical protein n=1 Tax=Azonexus sp. TaxID=1872668 RepID=UPI0035B317F3
MTTSTDAEIRLTIARLIELAYSANDGLTTKIVRDVGAFRLTVDQDGNAELTGRAGVVRLSGTPALEKIGVAMRRLTVNFTGYENGDIHYTAGVGVKGGGMLTVSGSFNIVKLITACSGLVCRAARHIKGQRPAADLELQRAMGY